jgi:hypothetical protein
MGMEKDRMKCACQSKLFLYERMEMGDIVCRISRYDMIRYEVWREKSGRPGDRDVLSGPARFAKRDGILIRKEKAMTVVTVLVPLHSVVIKEISIQFQYHASCVCELTGYSFKCIN